MKTRFMDLYIPGRSPNPSPLMLTSSKTFEDNLLPTHELEAEIWVSDDLCDNTKKECNVSEQV